MMLAAGRGTRLGALTEYTPKPLLPVANLPVMAWGIHSLRRLGVTTIGANVSYHGQQIVDQFGDGQRYGVDLHWSREAEPTGTAGGLKGMQQALGDDLVIVIAGDAMLDIDLTPLVTAHRAQGAFASLATIAVQDPSQYGVVVTDSARRIVRFQEKPEPGTEISRQANTGIYLLDAGVFDLIPPGEFCDFAMNVFPDILRLNLPFFAFPLEGYWTDIGNPRDYLQANLDYLAQRIRIEGIGRHVGGNLLADDAEVSGCTLANCVIGAGATLPRGTTLRNSVVWPDTHLADPLQLDTAVLTPWGSYLVDGRGMRQVGPPDGV
jgi:NDP-sugar pyrophosphorylase family protein